MGWAIDGLSRYAFGSPVRELEREFMLCRLFGVFVSKTTCIRLGERGGTCYTTGVGS